MILTFECDETVDDELSSVASTMTEESMAAEEEDAEEEEAEEPEPAADLVGMSEQEKRLMGAMGKHVD